jgi:hypothetical protein
MTICTREVAALFERAKLYRHEALQAWKLHCGGFADHLPQSVVHTREKGYLLNQIFLPHKIRNIIIHSHAMFVVDDLTF